MRQRSMNEQLKIRDIQEFCGTYKELFTKIHNRLLENVKDQLDQIQNYTNFVLITVQLLARERDNLHGFQKKEMVIDIVKGVVDNMTISDQEKQQIRDCIFPTLDNTVDLFIATAKGYLFLNKAKDYMTDSCIKCKKSCKEGGCFGCKRGKRHNKQFQPRVLEPPIDGNGDVDITALSNIVYDQIRGVVTHKKITIANILSIVTLSMQLVQQFALVDGPNKKAIVLNVINRLMDELPVEETDKQAIKILIDTTLNKTIDLIIDIANGKVDLLGSIEDTVARCKLMCGC